MGIGDVYELRFRAIANILGIHTAKPDCNDLPYDCLIKFPDNNNWFTAQVKKIGKSQYNPKYKPQRQVDIRHGGFKRVTSGVYRSDRKPYDSGDFDYLVAIDDTDIFLIPFDDLRGKYRIDLAAKKWQTYKLHDPSTTP